MAQRSLNIFMAVLACGWFQLHQLQMVAGQPYLDPNLPTTVSPTEYQLWFHPDFYYEGSTFQGRSRINIEVLTDTDYIILHYKMMNITRTALVDIYDVEIPLQAVFGYNVNEYWVVQTVSVLPAGTKVALLLEFNGSLTNGIVGYYKSTYIDDFTGQKHWLATTKFQPSDARKAFPCFDEPRFKTPFTITLKHWQNFTAITNTIASGYLDNDNVWRETTFKKTPPMSSYLVCFIVCDFAHQNNTLTNGIPHRVWARSDRIQQTDYALWAGRIVQDFYVNEFGTPYPLPKLDQFGVPDYPSGATEHWGLITYRDTRLLLDPLQTGDFDRQNTLSLIAHEISHNHVGDLVTCEKWDELWLNEGFASFYELKGVTAADPAMYYDGQFYSRVLQPVMDTDAGNNSRPLVITISTPNEANAVFDSITYDKGASVLTMLEGFLGPDTFRKGIRRYIQDNAYGSVTSDLLWQAMQTEVGSTDVLNIKDVMSQWISIMGLPVINVIRHPGNQLQLQQNRFLMDPAADPTLPPVQFGYKWTIPVKFRTQGGISGLYWLNMSNIIVNSPTPTETEWIKFNYDHSGYYRVNYPLDMWQLFIQQLNTNYTAFSDRERSNLLSDALSLARAGQLVYSIALDLSQYMTLDSDLLPWDTVLSTFSYLTEQLYTDIDFSLWQTHVNDLSYPLLQKLKIVDEGTHVEKLNRKNAIKLSCDCGNTECLQNTTRLFNAWIIDQNRFAVPLNLRREVYAFGMTASGGSEASWTTVWNRYTVATSGQEKDNLLYSLSRTTSLTLIDRLLQYSMNESMIRSQDFFTTISYASSNRVTNNYVWNWVQINYEAIVNRFGLDNRSLGHMVPDIVSGYNTEAQLLEVEAFFAKYPDAGTGERFRQEALQSIRTNIDWLSRSRDEIITWLRALPK
jgi:glutamyl aminopeptidase